VTAKRKRSRDHAKHLQVLRSSIHGRGVFATKRIRKGTRIIEYTGERLPWMIAQDLPPHDPTQPYHTWYFTLDDGNVIDAGTGGNEARWINHSCEPNCETDEKDGRIFVYALRAIEPGEELFYDYKIVPAERRTKQIEREFACYCGSDDCRGTMLEPRKKRRPRRTVT
jgi:SET domain-containing protein